jgi:hypothetical protein
MHKNAGRLNFSVVQLLVVIGVAAVVPPLLVGAYALYQLITSNHEQQKRELAATAQSLRLLVDRELETLRRKAELLGGARELLNGDPDVAKRLLDDGAMRTGHGFVLLDRTGGMIAKSDFDESPDQILRRAFRGSYTRATLWSATSPLRTMGALPLQCLFLWSLMRPFCVFSPWSLIETISRK